VCVCVCVCVCAIILYLDNGLAMGWSLVRGILPSVKNDYGTEQETRALNGLEEPWKIFLTNSIRNEWVYARSRDSSVGIVMEDGRQATGWTAGFMSWQEQGYSLLHSVQTGSGAHPASCPAVTEGYSPGVKGLGREADHTPQSTAEVKNGGDTSPLPYVCMA
jgi:hypothetical protein